MINFSFVFPTLTSYKYYSIIYIYKHLDIRKQNCTDIFNSQYYVSVTTGAGSDVAGGGDG